MKHFLDEDPSAMEGDCKIWKGLVEIVSSNIRTRHNKLYWYIQRQLEVLLPLARPWKHREGSKCSGVQIVIGQVQERKIIQGLPRQDLSWKIPPQILREH